MKKVELLAPAGDLEKLKMAIIYGADAVYIGGSMLGLRTASKNFTDDEMIEGLDFAHSHNVKVYVTVNIIAHNKDFNGIESYLKNLEKLGVDALIVADPGILMIAKNVIPNMELHLSTQANNTNSHSAKFWHYQGVKRIVVARELSLEEIKDIVNTTPNTLEIEAFVHGAMCMSYSGRCLISNYMTGRDANHGECAQPCRWNYSLVEKTRPGEYYPIEEDENGTYFFNSKDLCMIEHIPELIESGVMSLKIEGRVKTPFYVATVIRAYRMAIDKYYENPKEYKFKSEWLDELMKASYRDYTTGFFFGKPNEDANNYGTSSYIRNYDFVGIITEFDEKTGLSKLEVRNRIFKGDEIEIIGPNYETVNTVVKHIYNENMDEMDVAPRPKEVIFIDAVMTTKENCIVRKKSN
ncbi:MAG: peptidase U32 family protein [Filifactoraceae bacterium]